MSKSYSFQWAEAVYYGFYHTYVRATDIFKQMHRVSDYRLTHILATDQPRWEKFKKVVKRIDKWLKAHTFEDNEPLTTQMLRCLYVILAREFFFYDESRELALDMKIDESIIEYGQNHRLEGEQKANLPSFAPNPEVKHDKSL